MSRARQTFAGAAWNHIARTLEYGSAFFSSVLIARGLGVDGNGVFAGMLSLSQLLSVATSFGLETSLNKHIPQLDPSRSKQQVRYVLRRLIAFRVGIFVLITILLLLVTSLVRMDFLASIREYVLLLCVFTGCRSIVPLISMALVARLATDVNAKVTLGIRLIEVAAIGVLLSTDAMTIPNLIALLIGTSIMHITAFIAMARSYLIGTEIRFPLMPVLTFGGMFWINTVSEFFLGKHGDILFLSHLAGTKQSSLYDIAFSAAQLAALGATVGLTGVSLAAFSSLAVDGPVKLNRFYDFMIRILSFLTVPLYAFLLFNGRSALHLIYSDRFDAAFPLLQVIVGFRIFSRLFGGPENAEFLLSKNHVAPLVGVGLIGTLLNAGLNIVLIPRLGAMGATIASGIGNLSANILAARLVYRFTGGSPQLMFWLKLCLISCVSSVLCHALVPATTLWALTGQAGLYVLCVMTALAVAKPMTDADTLWLAQVSGRFGRLLRPFTRAVPSF